MRTATKLKAVPELLKLDLGCGQVPKEGFAGVDIAKAAKPDYVCDLTKTPWPWKSESIGEAYSSHFVEHLTAPQRIKFFEELWRVLVPGGTAQIITPYWASMRAIQDPTHQWPPVCEGFYQYLDKEWLKANKLEHQHDYKCDFTRVDGYALDPTWATRTPEVAAFALRHYNHVASDLAVTLTKRG